MALSASFTDVPDALARLRTACLRALSRLPSVAILAATTEARALANAGYVYVFVAGTNHVEGPSNDIALLDLAAIFLGKAVAHAAPR